MSLLQASGLRRSYGGQTVLDIDELSIGSGEVVAVLGPNGAGKSTLCRLLLLIERADAGRILLGGRAVGPGDLEARRRLAGVFQHPILFRGTVASNLAYGLRVRGWGRRERERRVGEILVSLGIERLADAPVESLSGGEAQRVALGRALALSPDLLILDEPTSSLDITVQRHFQADLARLVRSHSRGALIVTHDPIEAFTLADKIVVIENGRIVQSGSPEEVRRSPATPFIAAFLGAELLGGGVVQSLKGDRVRVGLAGGEVVDLSRRGMEVGAGDRVELAYRPEEVVLLPAASYRGSRCGANEFRLRVVHLAPLGGGVRVELEGGMRLVATILHSDLDRLAIGPGSEVVAVVGEETLHLYRVEVPTPHTHPGDGADYRRR